MQELIRTALVQNYDLREAVVRVEAARANLGITRANPFPTIAAGADATSQRNSRNGSLALRWAPSERSFGGFALNLLSSRLIYGDGCAAPLNARADLLATEENRKPS